MKPVNKADRSKLVEECFKGRDLAKPTKDKCEKMEKGEDFCKTYPFPAQMWRHGWVCPMATHTTIHVATEKEKVRVGQQKQKKKG